MYMFALYFFFQAEDGIRDLYVTGVQTCALPISAATLARVIQNSNARDVIGISAFPTSLPFYLRRAIPRSEERRVGKECRSRWSPCQYSIRCRNCRYYY